MNSFIVFITAFFSATILPLGSEAVLLFYANLEPNNLLFLWFWATLGNTLGGLTNWFLGRFLIGYESRRWFPIKQAHRLKAQGVFQRYGLWSLLFTWLPVVGDGIALVSGMLGTKMRYFLPLVCIGKGARYAIVLYGQNLFLN
ncbi:YqaA family protein [Marinomonas dokdonensis]|uniref:YqaA family protein n=1 Tax=Marinomonas dokdonensis TaxID=328224 RepID=UPI0040553E12